jgi:outer membrane scaffolding protein for murein synthesis (MipA/OmpV family)
VPRRHALARIVVLPALLGPVLCLAASQPLWELGMGVGAVTFSDYPGSATRHTYAVPVPYLRYRGKFLRSDRDGVRGVLLDQPRATINLSVGASVPVRSSAGGVRAGMPNLRATLEAGPSLDLHLWRSADRQVALDLRLPARLAVTVAARPQAVGWFMAPNLNLDIHRPAGAGGWNLGLLAGPLYATRRYNDYYYSVPNAYANAQRPAYGAPGGYAGTQFVAALSRRLPQAWVGAFLRYENLDGAVFAASPLLRRNHDVAAGFGVAWILGHSTRQAEADE